MDYEEMILSKQDDIYDGITELEEVDIKIFDITTGRYNTVKTLTGEAAKEYLYQRGSW